MYVLGRSAEEADVAGADGVNDPDNPGCADRSDAVDRPGASDSADFAGSVDPVDDTNDADGRPTGLLGRYRAPDGSDGAAVGFDLDGPHAGLVVGKRGSGKSYTLGVIAEEAARARGVAPVIVDPMGVFSGLAGDRGGADAERAGDGRGASSAPIPARVIEKPAVRVDSLPPAAWPALLGLDSSSPAGSLVWRVANDASTLAAMRAAVARADVPEDTRRAAANHLRMAASWDVFDPDGCSPEALAGGEATVLDLSGYAPEPMRAVVAAVANGLYEARVNGGIRRLPWLLVDEAHAFFEGTSAPALRRLLTRGRAPGVSLFAATQRPSALPGVAVSQADLLIAHRLTSTADIDALAAARPTYLGGTLRERLPAETGCALVVDDATESVHGVRVRRRETPHGGSSPRASQADRRS